MAHPKSKISKQRKRKRRTHKKLTEPQVAICAKTGEAHLMHRAYWHDGSMYYNGQMVIQASADADDVSFTEV